MARKSKPPKWEDSPFATLEDARALAVRLGMYAASITDVKVPPGIEGFQITQQGQTTIIARKGKGPVRQMTLPKPKRKRRSRTYGKRQPPLEERQIGYYRYVVSPWERIGGIRTMVEAREAHGFRLEPTFEGHFMSFIGASMAYFEYLEDVGTGTVYTRTVSKPVPEWPIQIHKAEMQGRRQDPDAITEELKEYLQLRMKFRTSADG